MAGEPEDEIPDLTGGLPVARILDGAPRVGMVGKEKVLVCRAGGTVSAFGASCPHLGGPLDEGLMENGVVSCPWHHARFDLRTGAALTAPAFDHLTAYDVRVDQGLVVVSGPSPSPRRTDSLVKAGHEPMVIVGGGAAGFAAADALRSGGWTGDVMLISADQYPPYDRTLLTKDYLEGQFGNDRLPIARRRLDEIGVVAVLDTSVQGIDLDGKTLKLSDGRVQRYGKLLLATGARPRAVKFPGADGRNVHYLRSLTDCRRLLGAIGSARRVTVLGGSFIGLEAAASIRARGLEVDLVTAEHQPMSKVFGEAISDLIVNVHRAHGVGMRLGRKIARIEHDEITLDDGAVLNADLTLVGIGVEPCTELASAAGLAIDRGVLVDPLLRTSAPDVYAAGDIARWPDPHSGMAIRVEHWVVAERQGQIAAANMLGAATPFEDVPFFWTKHFDLAIRYVGHADQWDDLIIEGSVSDRDALVRYRKAGRDVAVATVGRDLASLEVEQAMARRLADTREVRDAE